MFRSYRGSHRFLIVPRPQMKVISRLVFRISDLWNEFTSCIIRIYASRWTFSLNLSWTLIGYYRWIIFLMMIEHAAKYHSIFNYGEVRWNKNDQPERLVFLIFSRPLSYWKIIIWFVEAIYIFEQGMFYCSMDEIETVSESNFRFEYHSFAWSLKMWIKPRQFEIISAKTKRLTKHSISVSNHTKVKIAFRIIHSSCR